MPYSDFIQRGAAPTYSGVAGTHPLIPEDVQKAIVQGAVEKSAVLRFMPQRKLSRNVQRIPVLDTLPTAYFVTGETGLKQTTSMAWRNVFIYVEEIACIVPIAENLLADTDYDLWGQIRPKVEEAFGIVIDGAILFGVGKPASWPIDISTSAVSAGNTATVGVGIDIADTMNNVMAAVESDGYDVTAWVHRQDLRASLRGLRSNTNEFIFKDGERGAEGSSYGDNATSRNGSIFNVPARSIMNGSFEAANVATTLSTRGICGDFSQAIVGVRDDLTVKLFDQGVIQDGLGDIQFNLLQQDMVAMRFTMRLGWAVPNPVNRIQSVTASRYPFGVLRDAV